MLIRKLINSIIPVFVSLVLVLIISGCHKGGENNSNSEAMGINETINVIHSRRSVRNFIERPVSDDDITTLLKAGMAAPSGKNIRPWFFYVIKDRTLLNRLAEELPTAKMLSGVSTAIMVCGDINVADTTSYRDYWVMDCSAASENILLAAESLGLGAVWTALFPYKERIATAREIVGLPENLIPLNIIPVGYPAGIDKPKDKWDPSRVKVIGRD